MAILNKKTAHCNPCNSQFKQYGKFIDYPYCPNCFIQYLGNGKLTNTINIIADFMEYRGYERNSEFIDAEIKEFALRFFNTEITVNP